jgi:putative FmdB family regulatory protein
MPIYAYKCDTCGYSKDILQKMSDPLLTDCPSCSKATFKKQLTAAGFQLKGTGWYVTDFREGAGKSSAPAADTKSDSTESGATAKTSTASTTDAAAPANTTPVIPAATAPAPSAATPAASTT